MNNVEILQEALQLNPQERYLVVESLLESLDKPDQEINKVWADEAEKRLQDYTKNKIKTISFNKIFDS